jgi:CRISPR-associated endonuclease/helicase Cas3
MIVTFISQCEKGAVARTRRVLDAFADRIGQNTWQTIITEEGLAAVKKLLRKTATKNTAVSCHWIRSRKRSEMIWVVGRKAEFNEQGMIPVNKTKSKNYKETFENWQYMPLIKSLVAVAALFHDWGKATVAFQNKLTNATKNRKGPSDPLRHEWVSCLLLKALVEQAGDEYQDSSWLKMIVNGSWKEDELKNSCLKNCRNPLESLPPLAEMVAWLILTHHKLPQVAHSKDVANFNSVDDIATTSSEMLLKFRAKLGYENKPHQEDEAYKKLLSQCLTFENGLLTQSKPWLEKIQKWAARLSESEHLAIASNKSGASRVVLHHARLCLMLGDHFYSSKPRDLSWGDNLNLFANTENGGGSVVLKQRLDEHLVGVSDEAIKIAHHLPRFKSMDLSENIMALKKQSAPEFDWQDKAVAEINKALKKNQEAKTTDAWFVVNMASTGTGKTTANAKIMRALSEDGEGLRFILALGLRTLTLQTGDEYKERMKLDDRDMAVLVGSSAVRDLHNGLKSIGESLDFETLGSESEEDLMQEEMKGDDFWSEEQLPEFLNTLFSNQKTKNKNKAFLYSPVLVCTIDHMMAATETIKGGKYILPCLRLLSSDLVVDEVDDFSGSDLIAIGRLIHLAGMLGRKVMLSSATITPDLAEGFFHAYKSGRNIYKSFMGVEVAKEIFCTWVDEFGTKVEVIESGNKENKENDYKNAHQKFIDKRVLMLMAQPPKRKAVLVNCSDLKPSELDVSPLAVDTIENAYFEKIKNQAELMHTMNHTIDEKTGKRISFGVVRVANIAPCIHLSKYLINAKWSDEFEVRIMPYHSRQVLLLRSEQERYLEGVLKRKEGVGVQPNFLNDRVIRGHIDEAVATKNIIFILVATPVEEVGRDHDFDWAIIEPSSYRSIVQMSGRVMRHRAAPKNGVVNPNVALMQYNLRALKNPGVESFNRPGYETGRRWKLDAHNLDALVNMADLEKSIDAIPRIKKSKEKDRKLSLSELEHSSIADSLTNYSQKCASNLEGFISGYWWMTAFPQQAHEFRKSAPTVQLCLEWDVRGEYFTHRDKNGKFSVGNQNMTFNIELENEKHQHKRLWLKRDYEGSLRKQCEINHLDKLNADEAQRMKKASQRFGEINYDGLLVSIDRPRCFYEENFGILKINTNSKI